MFVDGTAIVDTGSNDNTPQICSTWKCISLFDVFVKDPFSFAEARNASLQLADKLHPTWVLIIDADETLEFPHGMDSAKEMLRKLAVDHPNIDAVLVEQVEEYDDGHLPPMRTAAMRLFRPGRFHYERDIHNTPVFHREVSDSSNVAFVGPLIRVVHHCTQEGRKLKADRTRKMLRTALERDPDDYDSMFYMAQAEGLHSENTALHWINKYLVAFREGHIPKERLHNSAFHTMTKMLMNQGRLSEAEQIAKLGLSTVGHDLDLYLALSDIGSLIEDEDLMLYGSIGYVDTLADLRNNQSAIINRNVFSDNPNTYLLVCYRLSMIYLGRALDAIARIDDVRDEADNDHIAAIMGLVHRTFDEQNIISVLREFGESRIVLPTPVMPKGFTGGIKGRNKGRGDGQSH
jgi:glycosyltransferase involved in cell wall biosynthesis